jgi:hypothetical protein
MQQQPTRHSLTHRYHQPWSIRPDIDGYNNNYFVLYWVGLGWFDVPCSLRCSDLFFSASKGPKINAWRSDTGERIGTYNGHNGAVWSVDVDCMFALHKDSTLLKQTTPEISMLGQHYCASRARARRREASLSATYSLVDW